MITGIEYWAWIGTFALIVMSYSDIKKMEIDDRRNMFMAGVTAALIPWLQLQFWYIVLIVVLSITFYMAFHKYWVIGRGDVSALTWIFMGYGFINAFKLAWFVIIMTLLTLLYLSIKWAVCRIKGLEFKTTPSPYMPVLLLCYIGNNILFGLY